MGVLVVAFVHIVAARMTTEVVAYFLGVCPMQCIWKLIAYRGTFIFKRDLKGCPTFSKLKTLLLNEWCVAIDLSALVCVLEHSPVLEKLILQISQDAECKTEAEGRNHRQMERVPKLSERLKLVEIKCKNVGFRVCEIISFLSRFMQVNLKLVTRNSHLFSFED